MEVKPYLLEKLKVSLKKFLKKENKFGIVNIMDFHGNVELMMFEDRLNELKDDFDLEEPIAFKVKISKDDQFTRISLRKIETLKEAKKEKIKTKQKRDSGTTINHCNQLFT